MLNFNTFETSVSAPSYVSLSLFWNPFIHIFQTKWGKSITSQVIYIPVLSEDTLAEILLSCNAIILDLIIADPHFLFFCHHLFIVVGKKKNNDNMLAVQWTDKHMCVDLSISATHTESWNVLLLDGRCASTQYRFGNAGGEKQGKIQYRDLRWSQLPLPFKSDLTTNRIKTNDVWHHHVWVCLISWFLSCWHFKRLTCVSTYRSPGDAERRDMSSTQGTQTLNWRCWQYSPPPPHPPLVLVACHLSHSSTTHFIGIAKEKD